MSRIGKRVGAVACASLLLGCGLSTAQTVPPPDNTPSERTSEPPFKGLEPTPYNRMVPVGERRAIGFFASVFPDCSSQGPVVMRLVRKPLHGTITFEESTSFPRYSAGSPVAACNAKRAPGMRLNYEAAEGYEGPDTFRVLVIYPDGTASDLDGHVSIR